MLEKGLSFSCSNVPRLGETPPSALPFRPAGCVKDGVRIRAQLLLAQPAGGIVGEQRLADRISQPQIAIAEHESSRT